MNSQFPPELRVRRFVGDIDGAHGLTWGVFTTESDHHFLLSCVQNPAFSVPVLKDALPAGTADSHGPAA